MTIYDRHTEFYNQPIRLTDEQKKEPVMVFSEFFIDHNLSEIRRRLADWLECALSTENDQYANAIQRGGIFNLAERLEELVEAAYILSKNKKDAYL